MAAYVNSKYLKLFIFLHIAIMLSGITICAGNNKLFLEKNTPFFERPERGAKLLFFNNKPLEVIVLEDKSHFWKDTPFAIEMNFSRVELPGNKTVWAAPDFKVNPSKSKITIEARKMAFTDSPFAAGLILTAGLGLLSGYLAVRKKVIARMFFCDNDLSTTDKLLGIAMIVSVSWFILCLILLFTGNVYNLPNDERAYFRIAGDIASGRWGVYNQWVYTIGYPLFLVPLRSCIPAAKYCEFMVSHYYFNAFIIYPLFSAITFLFLTKLFKRSGFAFIAVITAILLPLIYFPQENWNAGVFGSIITFPDMFSRNWLWFYLFHNYGLLGLSSGASFLMVMICLLLSIILPKVNIVYFVLIAALFSFACLIRINNIFFSPVIACVFWERLKTVKNLKLSTIFIYMGISALVFLLVFLPQLIINYLNFKSVLAFPYYLHDHGRMAEGFAFDTLLEGIYFLINTNYIYLAVAVCGIMFCGNKRNRILLSLAIIPSFIFFCGFPEIGNHPIRFVRGAYPLMLAAGLTIPIWRDENIKLWRKLSMAGIVIVNLVAVRIYGFEFCHIFRVGPVLMVILYGAIPVFSICGILILTAGRFKLGIPLLVFIVIVYLSVPYVIFCLLVALLIWAFYDWGVEIFGFMKGRCLVS